MIVTGQKKNVVILSLDSGKILAINFSPNTGKVNSRFLYEPERELPKWGSFDLKSCPKDRFIFMVNKWTMSISVFELVDDRFLHLKQNISFSRQISYDLGDQFNSAFYGYIGNGDRLVYLIAGLRKTHYFVYEVQDNVLAYGGAFDAPGANQAESFYHLEGKVYFRRDEDDPLKEISLRKN